MPVIKILGGGCPKCRKLERNAVAACEQLGMPAKFEKVTDYAEIMKYEIMSTPALVVNEKCLHFGSVLSREELATLLAPYQENRH